MSDEISQARSITYNEVLAAIVITVTGGDENLATICSEAVACAASLMSPYSGNDVCDLDSALAAMFAAGMCHQRIAHLLPQKEIPE